jgi:hypothetical protein
MAFPSMTRVNWAAREMVGVGDQTAISTLFDGAVQRQLGAMMGKANGVSSPFTTTFTTGFNLLAFSPFQFYMSTPALYNSAGDVVGWNGAFLDYDPQAPGQPNVWAITNAAAAASSNVVLVPDAIPWIYARPVSVLTDTDARVQAAPTRAITSMPTRVRIAIELQFNILDEDDPVNEGWARIGQITDWSAPGVSPPGTPTVTPISYWDDPNVSAVIGENSDFGGTGGMAAPPSRAQVLLDGIVSGDTPNGIYATQPQKSMGIVQMLAAVRSRLTLLLSADSTYTWLSKMSTDMTIKGLRASILELQAGAINPFISTILAAGRYTQTAGTYTQVAASNSVAGFSNTVGNLTINFLQPRPCVIYAVTATISTTTGSSRHFIRAWGSTGASTSHVVVINIRDFADSPADADFSFTAIGAYTT